MKNLFKTFNLITLSLFIGSLLLIGCSTNNSTEVDTNVKTVKVNQEKQRPYDISENEEANIQLVKDYIDAILEVNAEKVKSLVNEGFKEYGPAASDSMTVEETLTFWGNTSETHSEEKAGVFYSVALRVNEGPLKGEWVDVWGNYTARDKKSQQPVTIPWHSAFFIENNKISARRSWWDNLAPSLQMGTVAPVQK